MQYRNLGKSGLKVSVIGLGTWFNTHNLDNQNITNQIIKRAFELGVNFFDTAESYGSGNAEISLGTALKYLNVPREELVISTKLFWQHKGSPKFGIPNTIGLSRKHLIEGLAGSLKRLQLNYVDILFAHRYDPQTPMEEICRAFNYLIEQGLTFYWGTSEWPAEQIREAYQVCDKLNLIKPIAEQPHYNMFIRDRFEVEYGYLFDAIGMGATVWSPLRGGILTGKYNNGIPKGTRLDSEIKIQYSEFLEEKRAEQVSKIEKLNLIAQKLGISQANLALAWVIKSNDVSSAIIGASNLTQLEENIKAVQAIELITKNVEEQIEQILQNRPMTKQDHHELSNFKPRR